MISVNYVDSVELTSVVSKKFREILIKIVANFAFYHQFDRKVPQKTTCFSDRKKSSGSGFHLVVEAVGCWVRVGKEDGPHYYSLKLVEDLSTGYMFVAVYRYKCNGLQNLFQMNVLNQQIMLL